MTLLVGCGECAEKVRGLIIFNPLPEMESGGVMLPCPCVPGWEGGVFKSLSFGVILLHLLVTCSLSLSL